MIFLSYLCIYENRFAALLFDSHNWEIRPSAPQNQGGIHRHQQRIYIFMMLVDFISPEKLPDWLVWLDWNFYEHKLALFMFVAVAFVLWVLWCLTKYGTAVG